MPSDQHIGEAVERYREAFLVRMAIVAQQQRAERAREMADLAACRTGDPTIARQRAA